MDFFATDILSDADFPRSFQPFASCSGPRAAEKIWPSGQIFDARTPLVVEEMSAPVWSTNMTPFGPYVRDIQLVRMVTPGEYAIYGAYTKVRVTLVEVMDLLGPIVLDWATEYLEEPLTAQTALCWRMDLVQTDTLSPKAAKLRTRRSISKR